MNLQFKDSVKDWELHPSLSFQIRRANFAVNLSNSHTIEWTRIAPHKVIVTALECDCFLEDHNKFHFSESS